MPMNWQRQQNSHPDLQSHLSYYLHHDHDSKLHVDVECTLYIYLYYFYQENECK